MVSFVLKLGNVILNNTWAKEKFMMKSKIYLEQCSNGSATCQKLVSSSY